MSELPAPKPPSKRFVFNQPSWSNPQQIGTADNFFNRSNQAYLDIAAEAERKRKEREARKQTLQTRGDAELREAKRRRVSDDSEDGDNSLSNEEKCRPAKQTPGLDSEKLDNDTLNSENSESSPKSLSKRYEDAIVARKVDTKSHHPSEVIDLEDEEEDESDDIIITKVKVPIPPDEDDFPVSDDEYAELARKAREKARRKRLEEEDLASATPDPPISTVENGGLQRSQSYHEPTPPPPTAEPLVQILITSRIPNTEPLIVCRKVSQRLKDVRLAWCQRQNFNPDFAPKVFMTWKGKRLFDVTTCKSLGIIGDPNGEILKGGDDKPGSEQAQVHMEAMTSELFEDYQKAKRRGIDEGDLDEVAARESTPVVQKPEVQVKIILKAKGFEDFKLIVKPVSSPAISPFR